MSVARHTVYNLLGAAIPIAVSLVTVPLYLSVIGEARFGVMAIVWLFLGYFTIFDLGLSLATSHHVASQGPGDGAALAKIFWSSIPINLVFGLIGGAVLLPIANYYFGHLMSDSTGVRPEILTAVPWLILAVPLATITGVLTGFLQGLNKFARLNIISAVGTILFQAIPLVAATIWSPKLTVVIPFALAARGITVLLLYIEVSKSTLRAHPIIFDVGLAKSMTKFGGWVTVSFLTGTLNAMADRFLIGILSGPKVVAHYTVPFNLGERLAIFGNSAGSALYPRFSAMPNDQVRPFSTRYERTLMAPLLVIHVCAIFAIQPFLQVWVGQEFASNSVLAGQILMAGFWFDSISRVPLYALRGKSSPQTVATIDLAQLLPCMIVLFAAFKYLGLPGVAIAYVFRVSANYALLASRVGSLRYNVGPVSACGVLLLASVATAGYPGDHDFLRVAVASFCVASAAAFAWAILPAEDRRLAADYLRSRASRT